MPKFSPQTSGTTHQRWCSYTRHTTLPQHQQHGTHTHLVCRAAVQRSRPHARPQLSSRRPARGSPSSCSSTSNVTSHDTSGGPRHTFARSSQGELQHFLTLPCTCLLYFTAQSAPLLIRRISSPTVPTANSCVSRARVTDGGGGPGSGDAASIYLYLHKKQRKVEKLRWSFTGKAQGRPGAHISLKYLLVFSRSHLAATEPPRQHHHTSTPPCRPPTLTSPTLPRRAGPRHFHALFAPP